MVRGMSEEEINRLANRLAMLVSDDGEADNAGRAVGTLARRLGISGGQLKAIFVAGMESAGAQSRRLAEQDARLQAMAAELEQTRESLHRAEATARSAIRERDALRRESEQLQDTLDRRRTTVQVRLVAAILVVAGLAGGGWLAINRPALHLSGTAPTSAPAADAPFYHTGVVHESNVALRTEPDASAPAIATLGEGTQVVVRRTLWHNLQQWVEVEYQGRDGYILSADVNLS